MHKHCGLSGANCASGQDAYELVMTYAILCGIVWIAAGGIALFASTNMKKMWIMISAGLFLFGYIIFIGLFGAVMVQVNQFTNGLKHGACSKVKKKFRRSGDEFMGYSICSFILIFCAIGCTGLPIFVL